MSGETYVFRGEWTDRKHWHHGAAPLPWPPVEAFLVALAERFPPSTDIGAVRGLADGWQIDFAADTFVLLVHAEVDQRGDVRSLTLDFAWTEPEDESTEGDLRTIFELAAGLGAETGAVVWFREDDAAVRDATDAARIAALLAQP